jgi:hypothetical protein
MHTELVPEIQEIQDKLKKMAAGNHAKQLLEIIHRKGWTDTQAHLVRVMLDSVVHQLEGIERTQKALIEAAEEIGTAKVS